MTLLLTNCFKMTTIIVIIIKSLLKAIGLNLKAKILDVFNLKNY